MPKFTIVEADSVPFPIRERHGPQATDTRAIVDAALASTTGVVRVSFATRKDAMDMYSRLYQWKRRHKTYANIGHRMDNWDIFVWIIKDEKEPTETPRA